MIGSIIGNALGLGLKIMDKVERNSDKIVLKNLKHEKKKWIIH